ncbi:hypothetical protein GGS26DRAFT_426104 [Hypomontagnella submonticulosa]|nr:hypothetical protein GGS26DRAFT_426104 [Hypomontagnella submonticulosa]
MSDVDFNSLPPAEQQALLNGPALQPPDGVNPNFDNPSNDDGLARKVLAVCFALGSAFVLLRAYVAWFVNKKPHFNDYMMLPAYALYVAFTGVLFIEADVGLFVHQWDFRLKDVPDQLHLFNTSTNLFVADIMLIKANVLLEWIRIFVPLGSRGFIYWTCIVLICINFLFYTAGLIAFNLTCIPHEKIWNRTIPGRCIDSRSIDIASATLSFILDLVILLLPQRIIWGLNMSSKKKLGVGSMFIFGIIGCIAAAFRLATTVQYAREQDITYIFSALTLWVYAETTCGVIVFCMPMVPKAFISLGFSGMLSSLKTWWHGTTEEKKSKSGAGSIWARTSPRRLKPRLYQELEENTLPLSTRGNDTDVDGSYQLQEVQQCSKGIVRTTHFTTTDSVVDGQLDPARDQLNRQHPWKTCP